MPHLLNKYSVGVSEISNAEVFPTISYGAGFNVLGNKDLFPYFGRTALSDDYQAFAINEVLLHLKLEYLAIVYLSDDPSLSTFAAISATL